jgi:hypothetical protein
MKKPRILLSGRENFWLGGGCKGEVAFHENSAHEEKLVFFRTKPWNRCISLFERFSATRMSNISAN